jgi:acetyltransferase
MALVAEDTAGQILGVARVVFDPEVETAEFALLVRSDRQKHGLGGLLLQAILDYAASRGVRRVWGDVARDNGRMLELAQTLGFHRQDGEDPTQFRLAWTPPA